MIQTIFTVTENIPLTKDVMKMTLTGDCSHITVPGQFVNLKIEGRYLRRPISVCDRQGNTLTLIYKIVGGGTEDMSRMAPGTEIDILTGLGNGYDLSKSGDRPLLVGGGVGVPPLYLLAKDLIAQGKQVTVILGFNTASEVFWEEEFKAIGCAVRVTTVDGTKGIKGFVTDALEGIDATYFFTCGPEPMLKALYNKTEISGQFSFEERMGCSCKTKYGNKRICKDGPVLEKEEIIW